MAIEILGWDDAHAYAGMANPMCGDAYAGYGVSWPTYAGGLYDEIVGDDPWYAGEHAAYGDQAVYGDQAAYGVDPDLQHLLAVTGAAPLAPPRPNPPPMPHPMMMHPHMMHHAHMMQRRPAQPRLAPGVRPKAVQVVEKPGESLRSWAIGFDSITPIPGNATQTVTTQPQVLFRGERLTVPNDIAGDFLILDLKIGNRSQLASGQFGLPARSYVETAIDNTLHMDTAQISQFIQMLVQNINSQPRRFLAQVKGKAVIP